ncbi:hypothetical protein JCM33374_g2087 [Metschnikowia sp. JCM 33374]|nr:hypothetical protein JCM33374_g2087 [Metschnikowia sp. JCM 33374]
MGLFSKRSASKKPSAALGISPEKEKRKPEKPEKSEKPQKPGKYAQKSSSGHIQPQKHQLNGLNANLEPSRSPRSISENSIPRKSPEKNPTYTHKKRISTVVDDSHFADFEKDDYDDADSSSLEQNALDSNGSEVSDDEDDDYEEHSHVMLERDRSHTISQLSALMGYCGLGPSENSESLKKLANEVSRRTFSLLNTDLKIQRLSPTMRSSDAHFHDSVIGDHQLELVKQLQTQIRRILDSSSSQTSPYDLLTNNRTLWDRYGSIKDIIGRGAYGVIRIVDSGEAKGDPSGRTRTYAVKELQKRPPSSNKAKETKDQFIERVISEFIVSSTLNNKHVIRTLDLMITLPEKNRVSSADLYEEARISQVMDCTSGGDLFHYCKKSITSHEYLSIDEIDCMVKQITKGLWYMHSHGVAHCDLKLENILLENDPNSIKRINNKKRCRLNLKISDFGKASVVRTQWDNEEQLSTSNIPIGSEPYMAPEEHVKSHGGISLLKKDCWALGVIALILFNIRRSFFYKSNGSQCQLEYYDTKVGEADTKSYGAAYLWQTTEPRSLKLGKYKDAVFGEYVKNAMVSDYDAKTKEWSVHKRGKFIPIETMFDIPAHFQDPSYDGDVDTFEKDDFDLRKYCTYKLLDINPAKRLHAGGFLKSDWLASVESCGD